MKLGNASHMLLLFLSGASGLDLDGRIVYPPDFQRSSGANMAKLRADTLAGYDKLTSPTSTRVTDVASAAGTDVSVQLRFYKLQEVAIDQGSLTAKVWWRMKWVDERLAWNESDYGGITQVEYLATSYTDPGTEIWLPDVTAYNAKFGLMASFDAAVARVSSSGQVVWSRPGTLDVICRFAGLMMFPLEGHISCALEIGGWFRSGGFQGVLPYYKFDEELGKNVPDCATGIPAYEESSAYSYAPTQSHNHDHNRNHHTAATLYHPTPPHTTPPRPTPYHPIPPPPTHPPTRPRPCDSPPFLPGQATPTPTANHAVPTHFLPPTSFSWPRRYTEYEINKLDCEEHVYAYDCCPNEPWPVLKIRMHVSRSFPFYAIGFLMPLIIFTFLSFTVFLTGEKSGERLGLGVTLVLVVEVTKYTLQAWLPKCGELLWMDLFILTNTVFTSASLLWSVVVLSAHYSEEKTVVPKELRALVTGWRPFFRSVFNKNAPLDVLARKLSSLDASMEPLSALEGFNLAQCRQELGCVQLAPALGFKWVRLGSIPPGWEELKTKDGLKNKKLARALLELEHGSVLTLTLAEFERFELMGVVHDHCYVEVRPPIALSMSGQTHNMHMLYMCMLCMCMCMYMCM